MPHLKCEPCGSRMYRVGPADQVGDLCPRCGCLLEPVGELAELVGLKLTRPIKASDNRSPSPHQNIADELRDLIIRRYAAWAEARSN